VTNAKTQLARYAVCEQATLAAAVSGLRLRDGADDLLAVHCGDSVDLLGFDPAGPRRIAHIEKRSNDAKLHWETAPVTAADVDADGLGDLLVGFAATDAASGSPRGGSLIELVSTPNGGFAAARLLAPLHVAGLSAGRLDASAGADIAVLQREDTRLGRPNAIIALHGGPAPLKMFAAKAPDDMRTLTAVDLDLDGRDELVLTAQSEPPEVLHLGARGEIVGRAPLPLPAASSLLRADLNGDGSPDALFGGDKLSVVLASHDQPEQVQVLADDFATTQMAAMDINRDGKLDVVGVKANTVFAYIQSDPLRFDRVTVAVLPASEFALDGLVALSGSQPRLIVLRHSVAGPAHSEFAVVPLDTGSPKLSWAAQRTQLVDSPLSLRIAIF
jgi:hypothetical protein